MSSTNKVNSNKLNNNKITKKNNKNINIIKKGLYIFSEENNYLKKIAKSTYFNEFYDILYNYLSDDCKKEYIKISKLPIDIIKNMYYNKLKTYKKNLNKIISYISNFQISQLDDNNLKNKINDIYIITILLIVLLKFIYIQDIDSIFNINNINIQVGGSYFEYIKKCVQFTTILIDKLDSLLEKAVSLSPVLGICGASGCAAKISAAKTVTALIKSSIGCVGKAGGCLDNQNINRNIETGNNGNNENNENI